MYLEKKIRCKKNKKGGKKVQSFQMSKMKISKLEIYTIEEIQSFLESNIVLDLPVVVQDKIADFYMNDTSKEYNLNWPNKISRRKDFKIVCY